jgi:hypothetical protein
MAAVFTPTLSRVLKKMSCEQDNKHCLGEMFWKHFEEMFHPNDLEFYTGNFHVLFVEEMYVEKICMANMANLKNKPVGNRDHEMLGMGPFWEYKLYRN